MSLALEIKRVFTIMDAAQMVGVVIKRQTGKRASALCPIHQEKSPSFMIYLDKDIFRCFGCGKYGDAIDLYAMCNGLTNKEAIKILADRFNISMSTTQKISNQPVRQSESQRKQDYQGYYDELYAKLLTVHSEMDTTTSCIEEEKDLDREVVQLALSEMEMVSHYLDKLQQRSNEGLRFNFSLSWRVERLIWLWDHASIEENQEIG